MPRGVSRYDEAELQGRLWTPSALRPALWLDAADLSTITTVSCAVSEWRDKGINRINASQGSASLRPTLTTVNARNAILFDGADDVLTSSTGITTGTYTGALNAFWVALRNSSAGGTVLTERTSALVGVSQLFLNQYISSDGVSGASNHIIAQADYNKLGASGGVVSHSHSPGARDRFWINGESISVLDGAGSNITGASGYIIGRREVASQYWSGAICELVVTTETLTPSMRLLIEGCLAWKWGMTLTASHPFANRPPLLGD